MIHFSGVRHFAVPSSIVYDRLSKASFLVRCVKDAEQISEATDDRAAWKQKPGFSFVRTILDILMVIEERIYPTQIHVQLVSNGIGASSTIKASLTLQDHEGGTTVDWQADIVAMTGLLKLVPKGLITSAAQKVIEDTWTDIHNVLLADKA